MAWRGTTWSKRRLVDVADLCLGKMLDQRKNRGEYLPYLANVNVRWGAFDLSDLRQMRFEAHEKDRYGLKYGDIVMCEGGEPGRCALWKEEQPGMMIQKALHRIRPRNGLDNRFLYYSLLHQGKTGSFAPLFTGATIRHLPGQNLAKVELAIPPLTDQRRIADVLSAYDDLIENNRRRIRLLERAERMLYDEWFVRFRFPGHEDVIAETDVPAGWTTRRLSDICDTIGGGTPSTKVPEYWDGDVTWVVPSDVTNNDCLVLLDSERKITEKGLRESSARMVPAETILMTSRASVGFFALMDREVATNQGFINIIPHDERLRMYLLFNLMSRVAEIRANAKGTTYPEISKGRFRAMNIVIPGVALAEKFSDIALEVVRQVRCLKRSISQLKNARDAFLPRLMNGEIAV